jgi:hypothetical protein
MKERDMGRGSKSVKMRQKDSRRAKQKREARQIATAKEEARRKKMG